jgi:PKHD-type hydroxylase
VRSPISFPFADQPDPHVDWNSFVCEVLRFPSYANREVCSEILRLANRYDPVPGRLVGDRDGRRNRVRLVPLEDCTAWLFDLMRGLFLDANQRYQFDLAGFAEHLHAIEYQPGDHIDWHLDCGARENSTRKLAATILLTDPGEFDGGNLSFCAMTDLPAHGIGDAIVFPAFLGHRVEPVRRGTRTILAAWAHGSAFR